jgi:hypothetical protein
METFGVNIPGDKHEFDPKRWTRSSADANGNGNIHVNGHAAYSSEVPKRHPETGVNVLIVGAGMGGLVTALECWRKGHNIVAILERNDGPVYSGGYSRSYYRQ